MEDYIITIPVKTKSDPSLILEVAKKFGQHFEELTSEEIVVVEYGASVEPKEKSSDFDISFTTKIEPQQVCVLLTTAFDGGSIYYWCSEVEVYMPEDPDWSWCTPEQRKEWESVRDVYVAAMCGGHLVLKDSEDGKEYTIHKEDLIQGLRTMSKDHPRHFSDFIDENEDAITGDIFVQCCCFDEVIYG